MCASCQCLLSQLLSTAFNTPVHAPALPWVSAALPLTLPEPFLSAFHCFATRMGHARCSVTVHAHAQSHSYFSFPTFTIVSFTDSTCPMWKTICVLWHKFLRKVQYWQLIGIPRPISSSTVFIRTSAPPLTYTLTYCSCTYMWHFGDSIIDTDCMSEDPTYRQCTHLWSNNYILGMSMIHLLTLSHP